MPHRRGVHRARVARSLSSALSGGGLHKLAEHGQTDRPPRAAQDSEKATSAAASYAVPSGTDRRQPGQRVCAAAFDTPLGGLLASWPGRAPARAVPGPSEPVDEKRARVKEEHMHQDISRRDIMRAIGWGAAALAAAELGGPRAAFAEDAFTIAPAGRSWGDGLKQAYVVGPGFERRVNTQVSYAHMIESVIATKAIAQCGNPPFTVPANLNAEAVMLADGGCLQEYDLGVVTNYKDLLPGTF